MKWYLLLFFTPLCLSGQIRIDPTAFHSPEKEIRDILEATIQTFPKTKLPPLFITNSPEGPITLFERSARGEIIIKLNVRDRYWSQFIYQFAHEFTHVRSGFRADGKDNKWLEETLCETASLYALRKLSLTWRDHPRFDQYRHHLDEYAQSIIASRKPVSLKTLPAFYQKHRDTLRTDPRHRSLNGAMAVALLPLFEEDPTRWQSLASLNTTPAKNKLTFPAYFLKWYRDSSERSQPFILKLKTSFLPEK